MHRSPYLFLGVAAAVAACGDNTGPGDGASEFTAVNGATAPVIFAGDVIACEGRGFGEKRGDGQVLVTTGAGLVEAAVLEWQDDRVEAQLPGDVESGPVYVVPGADTLGPIELLVRATVAFDPAGRTWAEGTRLPRPLWGAGAATLRFPSGSMISSTVLLAAGADTDGNLTDSTYLGAVDVNGTLQQWIAAPDTIVPVPRYLHAMAGADHTNSRLSLEAVAYMIGGVDTARRVLADVLGISLTASGEYGLWTSLTPLPGGRAGAAVIVAFGSIVVVGGFGPDSLATTTVQTAVLNDNGTVNGWFAGPPLPEGRAFAAAAVAGTRLYVLGGETGMVRPDSSDPASPDLRSTVFAIDLSPRTGFFADSAWREVTPLSLPRSRHAAFALDGALVVAGGLYPGAPSAAESEFAVILPGADLEPFGPTDQQTIADMGGGALSIAAAPIVWDAQGSARVTLLGGRLLTGDVSHRVWWH